MNDCLYVIETKDEDIWSPTIDCRHNKDDAIEEMNKWEKLNPDGKFRVSLYYRVVVGNQSH